MKSIIPSVREEKEKQEGEAAQPEARDINMAALRLPVEAKHGVAMTRPSGILWRLIASVMTLPCLFDSIEETTTAMPSGTL